MRAMEGGAVHALVKAAANVELMRIRGPSQQPAEMPLPVLVAIELLPGLVQSLVLCVLRMPAFIYASFFGVCFLFYFI